MIATFSIDNITCVSINKPINKQRQKVIWSPSASTKPSETRVVH